ncbi:DUF1028 domain-containing protein [Prosthecomicrobium sp. N25]|uniref:DUF1028 domain-containing protein n=1 Tax=Prosthecomicrobium sp. N25 TaxID=3129254 RepID=UPI0030771157
MTWSIIARDPATGDLGLAVTTKFFAVGALCAFGAGRVGVVATQAFVNPLFGIDGLRLLGEGRPPAEVLAILLRDDPNAASRQVHVLSPDGATIRYTGEACVDWCGHVAGEHVSVAGNMLAGPRVVEATLETYLARMDLPFADRLLAALDAGQAEGGDKRGRQSAALKIWRAEPYPALDIRVDDHPEPLVELRRLHEVAYERFAAFMEALPSRTTPGGNPDRSWVDRRAAEMQAERRALAGR